MFHVSPFLRFLRFLFILLHRKEPRIVLRGERKSGSDITTHTTSKIKTRTERFPHQPQSVGRQSIQSSKIEIFFIKIC